MLRSIWWGLGKRLPDSIALAAATAAASSKNVPASESALKITALALGEEWWPCRARCSSGHKRRRERVQDA